VTLHLGERAGPVLQHCSPVLATMRANAPYALF